jgi:phage shock protein A
MANIFKRINDVFASNINELIDRVEDPERMIKQIIREMEENIRQAKDRVVDAIASEKKLAKEVAAHREQAANWQEKAESALRSGNESLARAALVRKQEHQKVLQSTEPAWKAAASTSEALKNQLRALEAKLDEAKRKKGTLVARQRAAEARQHLERSSTAFESGLRNYDNFGRMEERVAEIEARTEAISELNRGASDLEREILSMEVDTEVEAELDALKAKARADEV